MTDRFRLPRPHRICRSGRHAATLVVILLASCRPSATAPQISSAVPSQVPIATVPAVIPFTLAPASREPHSTPTSPPIPHLQGTILLSYFPPGSEMSSDLWLIDPVQGIVAPLAVHDEEAAFCCGRWSPDGSQIAYVRMSFADSASSLWIADPSGSSARQVSRPFFRSASHQGYSAGVQPQGIPNIIPRGWLPGGAEVLFFYEDAYRAVDILTGIDRGIPVPSPHITEFSQIAGLILMGSHDDSRDVTTFIVYDPVTNRTVAELPQDPHYSRVLSSYCCWYREASISPDSSTVAVSSLDRPQDIPTLWIVDVATGSWEPKLTLPALSPVEWLAWSPDGEWIAWYYLAYVPSTWAEHRAFFTFVSTHDWRVVRQVEYSRLAGTPRLVGWVNDTDGRTWLACLLPEIGIVLLDPDGDDGADPTLFPYRQLAASLPFPPEDAEEWSWQP